jgi:hypothetical protein
MDNERRADLGADAVMAAAYQTNVVRTDDAATAITDALAYVAHFCDRLGLDPAATFVHALQSYEGDFEDGPPADARLDPDERLSDVPGGRVRALIDLADMVAMGNTEYDRLSEIAAALLA